MRAFIKSAVVVLGLSVLATPAEILSAPGEARILRDRWGVPHIYGATPEAVAFGFGYAQAEDHLEAMFRLFAKARGELARVDGERVLAWDVVTRSLRIPEMVDADLDGIRPDVRRFAAAFAAGINNYVHRHPGCRKPWYWTLTGRDIFIYLRYGVLRDSYRVLQQQGQSGKGGEPDGSNAWAIGKSRSVTGYAMLHSGPHLAWKGDTQWTEAHLKCPEFDVAGATFFGMPQIAMGHNGHLAWANTSNVADVADLYMEKIHPKDPDLYLDNDGSWKRMKARRYEFAVRARDGSLKQVVREVRYTRRGPYLTPPGGKASYSFAVPAERSSDVVGAFDMMRARSIEEAKAALRVLAPHRRHFVMADRGGNIYVLGAGIFPRRHPRYDWSRPVPGWEKDAEWGPPLAFDELPQITNPPGGLIVQCNNSVFSSARPSPIDARDFPQYHAERGRASRASRAGRAYDLLDTKPKITWEDHLEAALDLRTLTSQPLLNLLLSTLREHKDELTDDLKQIEGILARWDGVATLENQAVPILAHAVRIAREKRIDMKTARGRAFEILQAVAADMRSLYGGVAQPMSRVLVLERGGREFPMPGAGNTGKLNPFTSLFMSGSDRYRNGKWYVNTGSSWIMVLSFGDPMKVFTLLPLGQSEDPASPHHTDQAELFSRRQLKPLPFTDAEVQRATEREYVLRLPQGDCRKERGD